MKKATGSLLVTFLASFPRALPAVAHGENQYQGHHMPMMGGMWGWGPTAVFWIVGVLLITLLAIILIKAAQH
ncbi:MAG: hypothetical protein ACOC88_03390 [Candidatus Bipolaricaulota bacterium]